MKHRTGRTWLRMSSITIVGTVAAALFGVAPAMAASVTPTPGATPDAVADAVAALTGANCGYNGAENQWMTRANAVARARSWINVTPYSQLKCHRNAYGDYRTDCSGMVSMAWGLGGYGSDWWTGNLDEVSHPIPAAELQAGDALLYSVSDPNKSHVALFVGWADAAHSKPIVVQETGWDPAENTIEGVPVNFDWHTYTPIRYDRIIDSSPNDASTVVQSPGGVVDAFGRGAGGGLLHWRYSPGAGSWVGPEDLGGSLVSAPSATVSSSGVVDVFFEGADLNLWHRWLSAGTWYGPQSLGMGPLGGPPNAVGQSNGSVDVFWKGTNNQLYAARYANVQTGWTGPTALGGSMMSAPSATVTSAGVVDVFFQGTDGSLWHRWLSGGTWYGPQSLGMGPLGGPPSVVGQSNGTVDTFWKGTNGQLYHAWYTPASGWLGPQAMGGAMASDPSVTLTGSGGLDVMFKGTDGNLWHRWFAGNTWYGPQSLGMGPLGGPPSVVGQPNGTVDTFWKGTNGQLYHGWYTPASGWLGPQALSGNLA
jgi:hypothetical protein